MHVAIVGGASTIGSTVAYTLAGMAPSLDVTLVDLDTDAAWAHATDISHAGYHFGNTPEATPAPETVGTIDTATTDEWEQVDPDLLLYNAAAPQPEDATDRGARGAELARNRRIVEDVAADLQVLDPTPILVVTNPVDRLVAHFHSLLGWPRRCFIGYSLSETARAADAIGDRLGVPRNDVYCPTMGEHGEHVVPVFSRARVAGDTVELSSNDREAVREYIQDVPFEIATKRGVAETSRWVTSAGVARVVRSIAADGGANSDSEPFCLSTPLDGEYGFDNVAMSVPVSLDRRGVAEIHEWDLSDSERREIRKAADAVRADLDRMDDANGNGS